MSSKLDLHYLVIGTGRCGTVHLAKLLTSVGIPCGHERIFTGGDIQTALQEAAAGDRENSECSAYFGLEFDGSPLAEASYMAVPFLEDEALHDCTLIHVVRDPLKVIRSFLNNICFFREERASLHPEEAFILRHLPQLELLGDAASRASYYYLRWNQMIEESVGGRRYFRHRIEDDPKDLLAFLGVNPDWPVSPEPTNAFSHWPGHMRPQTQLPGISDEEITSSLFWKEVAALSGHYGYPYASKFLPDLNRVHPDARRPGILQTSPLPPPQGGSNRKLPRLMEEGYRGFNLVGYRKSVYAVAQVLGPLDLTRLSDEELQNYQRRRKLFIGASREEAKRWIDRTQEP